MKIKKEVIIGLTVIVILASAFAFFMQGQNKRNRSSFAAHIVDIGNRNPSESIESLESSIALYESRIEQHIKDAAQTGVYWKILAVRFQDKELHNEALKALEQAINYNPLDPALHYLTGVSASISAKSAHDFNGIINSERDMLYNLAEKAFLRSIELNEKYLKPRYSLGVLYAFDLNRPEDAVPHLLKALEISRSDVDTMFVLARSYYMLSSYTEAVEMYDRIIKTTKDKDKLNEAQKNRQLVMERIYG
ncbi:MAG: tetratricopeptide repeat protein [Treponema sp.]|jgi:tetratricopeptide (TPR) repeat protein|nr:tetratricopeptide repeat protein [Treponema sp.]